MSLRGGGKELSRVQTRNSLAATLLERGHDLQWVSSTVDDVMRKAGYPRVQAIAQMPGGKNRASELFKLCTDCQITIPEVEARRSTKVIASQQSQKQRRLQPIQPDPNEYKIEHGFMIHHDGTNCSQIQSIANGATGICLLTPQQAEPWLREGQLLSKDELGLFIIGQPTMETTLETQELMLPCRTAGNQQVILAGTLVQMGNRKVKTIEDTKGKVDIKNCAIVACTAWKADWASEEWEEFMKNTMVKFRIALGLESNKDVLVNTWGRSLRKGSKIADELTAESIQIHGTFREEALPQVLSRSGFNGIFLNPKGATGRPSELYRILWVGGDVAHATSCAAKTQSCLGLVKGKKSLGLRFSVPTYEAAWKTLFPDADIPTNNGGIHAHKVENLPYGCDAKSIEQWGMQYGWGIKGVKGPRAWLVTTGAQAPEGILMFNGSPIITRYLPPRAKDTTSIVVAGPKPTKGQGKGVSAASSGVSIGDPWASFRTQSGMPLQAAPAAALPAANTRNLEGPIETKFQQQESRIKSLEDSVEQLVTAQKNLQAHTEAGFQAAEQRDNATKQMLAGSLQQFKHDMEKSVAQVVENQAKQFNDNIADLKRLLTQTVKRKNGEGEEMTD
eukprot:Skav236181  [mRNA]  locus=scaffold4167:100:1953:- [translate_table: standard]